MMKRETGIAIYFWATLVTSMVSGWKGHTVAWAVLLAAAAVIGVLNLIARDYFKEIGYE